MHQWYANNHQITMSYTVKYSLFTRILPEMEQSILFHQINFDVALEFPLDVPLEIIPGGQSNQTCMAMQLGQLMCPSDRGVGERSWTGITNYRANFGSRFRLNSKQGHLNGPCGNLIVPYGFQTSLESVRDGLSQTVALSEKLIGDLSFKTFNPRRHIGLADVDFSGDESINENAISDCGTSKIKSFGHYSYNGLAWMIGTIYHGGYNHVLEPNPLIPDCSTRGFGDPIGIVSARSNHPGGVNAAMADGSVRFIKNRISRQIWQALGTKAGGEFVSADDF
jgi:prepilin-type processing-associated H-X9-DG protein